MQRVKELYFFVCASRTLLFVQVSSDFIHYTISFHIYPSLVTTTLTRSSLRGEDDVVDGDAVESWEGEVSELISQKPNKKALGVSKDHDPLIALAIHHLNDRVA